MFHLLMLRCVRVSWRLCKHEVGSDGEASVVGCAIPVSLALEYVLQLGRSARLEVQNLCSGAYMAFHTGLEDSRVVAQVMLNPQTFEQHMSIFPPDVYLLPGHAGGGNVMNHLYHVIYTNSLTFSP